jgi:hypothetical protein
MSRSYSSSPPGASMRVAGLLYFIRHASPDEHAVRELRQHLNQVLTAATLVARMQMRLLWRLWWGLTESAFSGVRSRAFDFVLVHFTVICLQSP